jgi:hypothetical protein
MSLRHDTLDWSHHVEVGRIFEKPDEIQHWLGLAAKGNLSVRQLRLSIREHLAGTKSESGVSGVNAEETAPFALLRELRAVGRLIQTAKGTWAAWTPKACRQALDEIKPVSRFIEELNRRIENDRVA